MTAAKEFHQARLAFRNRVSAPLRDHESKRAHVPCAPFKFDKCSIREVVVNQMMRHVSPAQTSSQQIVFRAQVVHQPLAFTGNTLLGLFRIRLIVCYDELDVPAKFLSRDGPRDCGQRM